MTMKAALKSAALASVLCTGIAYAGDTVLWSGVWNDYYPVDAKNIFHISCWEPTDVFNSLDQCSQALASHLEEKAKFYRAYLGIKFVEHVEGKTHEFTSKDGETVLVG